MILFSFFKKNKKEDKKVLLDKEILSAQRDENFDNEQEDEDGQCINDKAEEGDNNEDEQHILDEEELKLKKSKEKVEVNSRDIAFLENNLVNALQEYQANLDDPEAHSNMLKAKDRVSNRKEKRTAPSSKISVSARRKPISIVSKNQTNLNRL